jgi:hypothetical protein
MSLQAGITTFTLPKIRKRTQEDQSLLSLDARKGQTAAAIVSILLEEWINQYLLPWNFLHMWLFKQQISLRLAF